VGHVRPTAALVSWTRGRCRQHNKGKRVGRCTPDSRGMYREQSFASPLVGSSGPNIDADGWEWGNITVWRENDGDGRDGGNKESEITG